MDPLSQLRDIHVPQWVGFWPLAIGWYFLALLTLLIFIAIGWVYRAKRRRFAARRAALAELATLRARYLRDQDDVAMAIELSMLLRRAALAAFPTAQVASLHNQEWLAFLDRMGKTCEFTQGAGQVLVSAPYQRQAVFQVDELFNLIDRWIQTNLTGGKSQG